MEVISIVYGDYNPTYNWGGTTLCWVDELNKRCKIVGQKSTWFYHCADENKLYLTSHLDGADSAKGFQVETGDISNEKKSVWVLYMQCIPSISIL